MIAIANRALWSDLRRIRPETLIYLSRSSATLAALMRSKLLRWMSGGSRVVMIGLQPRGLGGRSALMARFLWPDLLLVSTEGEAQRARRLGARADLLITGVDLDRFVPAAPGEKVALRRKWELPADAPTVLHVGHLTSGRNVEALIPLAALGMTVVMVASSQQDPESSDLEMRLVAAGITVLRGFLPIEEIYRLADCYVFPTLSPDYAIALPLSVLEAMATGLPVVATRFGALAERFGQAEGVVLVDEPRLIADAVVSVLAGHPDTRQHALAYSWDAVAQTVARTDR